MTYVVAELSTSCINILSLIVDEPHLIDAVCGSAASLADHVQRFTSWTSKRRPRIDLNLVAGERQVSRTQIFTHR